MRWKIMAFLLRLFGSHAPAVRASPDQDRRISDVQANHRRALEALERELELYQRHHHFKDIRQ